MDQVIGWLALHWMELFVAIHALVYAALGLAMVIPGDQPDKVLQKMVDLLSFFSRKPKSE